ncbi:hypothetical protein D3C72_1416780 [compost metagenome]
MEEHVARVALRNAHEQRNLRGVQPRDAGIAGFVRLHHGRRHLTLAARLQPGQGAAGWRALGAGQHAFALLQPLCGAIVRRRVVEVAARLGDAALLHGDVGAVRVALGEVVDHGAGLVRAPHRREAPRHREPGVDVVVGGIGQHRAHDLQRLRLLALPLEHARQREPRAGVLGVRGQHRLRGLRRAPVVAAGFSQIGQRQQPAAVSLLGLGHRVQRLPGPRQVAVGHEPVGAAQRQPQ